MGIGQTTDSSLPSRIHLGAAMTIQRLGLVCNGPERAASSKSSSMQLFGRDMIRPLFFPANTYYVQVCVLMCSNFDARAPCHATQT